MASIRLTIGPARQSIRCCTAGTQPFDPSCRVFEYASGMGVLRSVIAVFVIALAPASAWGQRVTKVPDGDTLVVDGVGKVHLLGIRSADQPALQLGPGGSLPPTRRNPPATPSAASGHINLTRDHPSRGRHAAQRGDAESRTSEDRSHP
jgi:hypothetical protein